MSLLCSFLVLFSTVAKLLAERPTEDERVNLWHENGNVWPPQWQPESDGYKATMAFREQEIMQLTGADERWENWMQYTQARLLPKFTAHGFEIIKTPLAIQEKLYKAVQAGVQNWDELRYEEGVADSIYAPNPPKFVDLGNLATEVLNDLKEYHENWVGGMKLRPTSAYGVRLYQNQSTIVMHNDKPHTHVISSIVHIDHAYDDDNQPWPIEIEDHDGVMHSVSLQRGEMLFYESAVCLHGRKRLLQGKYYGSIFLHYQPVDKNIWSYTVEDIIAAVPPHWNQGVTEDHGSRWAGQSITVDSQIVDNAPAREYGLTAKVYSDVDEADDNDFYANLPERDELAEDREETIGEEEESFQGEEGEL